MGRAGLQWACRWLRRVIVGGALLTAACAGPTAGQRWVAHLDLRGTRQLDAGAIVAGLATQKTGWWPCAKKRIFEPALLEQDLERIVAFYAAHGFFAAKIARQRVIARPDGRSVDVEIEVEEGPATRVASLTLAGLDALPADLRARVRRELPLQVGDRFVYGQYTASKRKIVALLQARGYAYADAVGDVEVDRRRRTARVRLRAQPGPRVRYARVTLRGNGPIPADKILHLVRLKAGDLHDPQRIAAARARLLRLDVFGTVALDLPKQPTERAELTVRVEPTKLRELRLGVGLGVDRERQEVHVKGLWTWRNFLGGLRTLALRVQPSYVVMPVVWAIDEHGVAVESDLKLTQPDLYGSGITAFGAIGYDLGIHPGYRFHGPRGQAGLERSFVRDHLSVGGSYNLQFLDFFDTVAGVFDPSATPLGLGFVDPYRLAWLEPFARLDLRDDLLDPRAGAFFELRLEQGLTALGGEFNYFKITPDARAFLPLGTKRLVLATRALFGYVRPSDATKGSPITRRYTFGGPTLHRGFSSGRLSPQGGGARKIPMGGNGALLLSAELRLRLLRLAGYWLGLTGFFDAGDVVANVAELRLGRLHLAVGGSLSYATPVGLISLGLGVRLNRLGYETDAKGQYVNPDPGERLAFHLTIGAAF